MRIYFILLASIIFLAGCATKYQPEGFTGGYSESQLGDNIFQVSFQGNSYTGHEIESDFALLRSAELTLQNGFRFFVVVRSSKDSSVSAYTTPSQLFTTKYAYGAETFYISKPSASNTIICFKEKPVGSGLIFDAAFVKQALKDKYRIADEQAR
jgi:hypothetical protein